MSSLSTLARVLPSIGRHVYTLAVILVCGSGALRSGTPSVSAAEADAVVPLPAPVEPKVEPAPVPVSSSAPLPRADLPEPARSGVAAPGAPAPGAPTAANAEGSPLILDEILVTATRRDEKTFDLPYSTQVLDGDTLNAQKAFRTLPESLREVPGVMIQKTSVGQGSPYIRGFTGYRTLLLIDGESAT